MTAGENKRKGAEMSEKQYCERMIIADYLRSKECKQTTWGYTCYKCGKCGRKFKNGFMVDDGGTTVEDEEE